MTEMMLEYWSEDAEHHARPAGSADARSSISRPLDSDDAPELMGCSGEAWPAAGPRLATAAGARRRSTSRAARPYRHHLPNGTR
jgi:hypothetical protein